MFVLISFTFVLLYLPMRAAAAMTNPYPLCQFVASTNIELYDTMWSCDTEGNPVSNPCEWSGIICDNNDTEDNATVLSI